MAAPRASTVLLKLRFGRLDLPHVLRRVFLEIFCAILAAKFNLASLMHINHRLAHFAQFFTRNDTSLQQIRFRLLLVILLGGQPGQRSRYSGNRQDSSRHDFENSHKPDATQVAEAIQIVFVGG